MWNEERGFGFIAPASGGDDVFVHRSALGEGVMLQPGATVSYEPVWDEKKRKDRAADVLIADPGPGSEGDGAGVGGAAAATAAPVAAARSHNIVGSWANWAISKEPMTAEGAEGGPVRHRLTIRKDAAKGSGAETRKEEFQILGDGSWDRRLYPVGGDKEETVLLQPGGPGSKAASVKGKGHGRNWAVEGKPGTAYDILYDADTQTVSCELAFSESRN